MKKPGVSRKIAKNVLADTQYSKREKRHDLRNKHAADKPNATSDYPSTVKKTKAHEQVPTNARSKIKRKQQQEQVSTETKSKSKRKKVNKNQDTDSNQVNNDAAPAIKKDKKLQKPKESKETSDLRLGKTKKDKNLKKPTEHKTDLNLSNTKKKRLSKRKMKQVVKQIRTKPEVEEKHSEKIVKLNEQEVNLSELNEMLAKPQRNRRTSSLPLRERMMTLLKSSRFRFINETLYKNDSSESKQYFQKDPDDFQAYHEGYKQQVQQWPVNPLDIIILSIKDM